MHGESSKLIPTPSDDLDPSTLQLTDEAKATLFGDGTDQNPGELSEIPQAASPLILFLLKIRMAALASWGRLMV
ncbi:hypothetical protein [Vibrio rumoiensis]|uniref:hypothetical protein n=1 Tax=Vibrio rumoiensis TaxID=76258 RepID=UPI000D783442|nr:hypothetical protein [Vibrio rumoiensis]